MTIVNRNVVDRSPLAVLIAWIISRGIEVGGGSIKSYKKRNWVNVEVFGFLFKHLPSSSSNKALLKHYLQHWGGRGGTINWGENFDQEITFESAVTIVGSVIVPIRIRRKYTITTNVLGLSSLYFLLVIGLLFKKNHLAPIGSSVICTWSPGDICEQIKGKEFYGSFQVSFIFFVVLFLSPHNSLHCFLHM